MDSQVLKRIIKEEIVKVMKEEKSKEQTHCTPEEQKILKDFGFHISGNTMSYEDSVDDGDDEMIDISLDVTKRDGAFFCEASSEYGPIGSKKKLNSAKSVVSWAKKIINGFK